MNKLIKTIISSTAIASITTLSIVSFANSSTNIMEEYEYFDYVSYDAEEVECLALNIYYEARSSNLADKAGVADVVLNRVLDSRYPDTICSVVQQGKQKPSWKDPNRMVMVRNACQFSWYCDGKADNPQDEDNWMEAQMIAWDMVENGQFRGISEGATHYHATYVSPRWASTLQMVGRLGAHIYYRWD